MPHLSRLDLKPDIPERGFPFDLPILRDFEPLRFDRSVTFFTGENGAGKSTLLEAIAASADLPTAGGADVETDDSLALARKLGDYLRLGWKKRTRRGFFLRAEDFFRFQHRVNASQKELGDLAASYEAEIAENPPPKRSISAAHRDIFWGSKGNSAPNMVTMPTPVRTAKPSSISLSSGSCRRGSICWTSRKRRSRRCASWPFSRF